MMTLSDMVELWLAELRQDNPQATNDDIFNALLELITILAKKAKEYRRAN